MSTFQELKIDEEIISLLAQNEIVSPTAVQEKVIPLVAAQKNVVFQSETGTGKTFAYLLPVVTRLKSQENPSKFPEIMIASPTYELASQIKSQVAKICSIKCALLIGGAPIARQIETLKEKPRILIGSSQRLLELIHLKKIKAEKITTLILDETDRLLSRELRESTESLMERLPPDVQLIGNSATVSDYTRKILQAKRDGLGGKGEIVLVEMPVENVLRERITHWAIFAERRKKIDTLRSFINAENPQKLIVFTGKADQIENIAEKLRFKKIQCETLSRKSDKNSRKASLDRFRSGKSKILITTDLASRGLDIPQISHVVQMDLPDEDFFVHRAGRTARAGKKGINVVLGDEIELKKFAHLEKKLGIIVYPKMLYRGKVVDPEPV